MSAKILDGKATAAAIKIELTERVAREGNEPERRRLIREALMIEKREVAHVPLHQQPIVWAARRGIELAPSPDNRLRLWLVRMP